MTFLLKILNRSGRALLTVFFIFLLLSSGTSAAGKEENVAVEPAKEEVASLIKKPEKPEISIPNLVTYMTRLSEHLIDLHSQLARIAPSVDIQEELPLIEKKLEDLSWETKMQQAETNLSYKRFSDTLHLVSTLQIELESITTPLQDSLQTLYEQKKYWMAEQETLQTWIDTLSSNKNFPSFKDDLDEIQESIALDLESIEKIMGDTLATLRRTSDIEIRLYELKATADTLLNEFRKGGFEQTSPSLFSSKFYSRLRLDLLQTTWNNTVTEVNKAYRVTLDNRWGLLLIITAPVLLSIIFILNMDKLKKHDNWSMLTECPVGFSVFTVLVFVVPFMDTTMAKMLPIISIGFILSVMRLAGKLEKQSIWVVRFIYALSFFLVLYLLIELTNLPLPLRRIYDLAGCTGWLIYFTWRLTKLGRQKHQYLRSVLVATCLALTVIILATILGYDKFSQYLFKGIFITIFLFISSVIMFYTIRILLELLLTMLPVIHRHAGTIITSLQPFIFLICALLFYASTASVWLLFPTSQDALNALATLGIPLGSYTLTMETIMITVSIIYGAILISRAIQAILLGEIMPRNNVDKGVQLSIARLVHYTILLLGFLILLKVMGADLTKLTILGGALGVGIGFGLQTIVNNFASGLILLFERPIKVGDTIELGTDLGEVKKLGLRSTIIQTYDNAEIVVPNSDLISGQVTNWTLAERKARVKIPVGVAYGTDISKVLEILLAVAGEHPMVLTTPAPNALFLAFGASSLDFELRVWVGDFSDRRLVQSELNQEINSEFADAGIEIPFPQTDLHLRTVDSEAAGALRSAGKTTTACGPWEAVQEESA